MKKLPTDGSIPTLSFFQCRTGVATDGCAVSASNDEGHITEGNVYCILPYGQEWLNKKWTPGCTIVITNHENGHLEHWDPRNVDVLRTDCVLCGEALSSDDFGGAHGACVDNYNK